MHGVIDNSKKMLADVMSPQHEGEDQIVYYCPRPMIIMVVRFSPMSYNTVAEDISCNVVRYPGIIHFLNVH